MPQIFPQDFSINNDLTRENISRKGENLSQSQEINERNEDENLNDVIDEDLQKAVNDFVSLFIQQMFSSMRDTIPESDLIDGGYAEDVFTEMMDEEISEMGAKQSQFKQLNQTIYRQLDQNN